MAKYLPNYLALEEDENGHRVRKRKRGSGKGRRGRLLKKFGSNCYYCGRAFQASSLTLEHKLPRSRGGTESDANLALACASCNLRKGSMTEEEFAVHEKKRRYYRHAIQRDIEAVGLLYPAVGAVLVGAPCDRLANRIVRRIMKEISQ